MLVANRSRDEVDYTSEISFFLNQFPANTNVFVVDTNFITLLNMKRIMRQHDYQVTIETDAKKALAFLTSCKHDINIVIWDYHMPEIDGLQALKSIASKMDLPVMIMSDDNQTESVMKAIVHGACDYVLKPVKEDKIANLWQHIVRKEVMSKRNISPSRPLITWNGELQPVQSDLLQFNVFNKHNYNHKTRNQDSGERNIEIIDKRVWKKTRKQRMTWTKDLHKKFLEAIEINGGIEKANPKVLLDCLQGMKIQGLTRNNVASHLQKHRIYLEEKQIPKQAQNIGWSTQCGAAPSLQGPNNVHTCISQFQQNHYHNRVVNPIQQNDHYQNGYLAMNKNPFITNPSMPRVSYFDNQPHQTQQQQSSPQFSYLTSNEEPGKASDIYAPDSQLIYPSLPYM
ncbi:PREDICTED: putative two-component response regulator ARR19 [Camelina sativa]|uniref:Two-component response regulator ARR19 n=1 Tax=Camelina sativa TaxID=90675 RepID=A0ABM1QWJ9_CAMSA|nr:PREDICTED: putative two-component response regulator ARR19 [Camelina sativa]